MALADARAARCTLCGQWIYLTVSGLWRHVTHDPAHDPEKDLDTVIEGADATRRVNWELMTAHSTEGAADA